VAVKDLGGGSQEFHIPLAELRGKDKPLTLRSDSKAALAFIVRGRVEARAGRREGPGGDQRRRAARTSTA
jgi:hypothetical protein